MKLKWPTIIFMLVMHVLAGVALLPQFWSVGSVSTLLILYWVTACLGVTLGYHRLLAHKSFQLPRWLARFFATCGALSGVILDGCSSEFLVRKEFVDMQEI